MDIEKMKRISESHEFKEAEAKIANWNDAIEKADINGIKQISSEKNSFFSKMRDERPEVYMVFRVDDKTLSEKISEKLTGRRIVID